MLCEFRGFCVVRRVLQQPPGHSIREPRAESRKPKAESRKPKADSVRYRMWSERSSLMPVKTQLGLLVALICLGFVVITHAQAAKSGGKAATKPRVFFIEPKNNATVASPVHMKFGSEGIKIEAVPPGDPTTARPGI